MVRSRTVAEREAAQSLPGAMMGAASRGHLTVFFGAAPGVGKTSAMLDAAQARKAAGVDVMVGVVDTHGARALQALLAGLPAVPPRDVSQGGAAPHMLDLDAALARRPQLILVDELAHTNHPQARHPKRWQDVQELLAAGIDVYTTLSVQHLESLNDVVAQITGVTERETVPDWLVEQADEVKLIDLPPDDLLQRLRAGVIALPEGKPGMADFFRKGNLIALRELALRRTADRVDAQMEVYRRDHAISAPWPAAPRLLVGISSGPAAERLVRAARRMAASLRAVWTVAYVETPAELRQSEADRERVIETLRLAERLGAETLTLSGSNAAAELLAYARARNISKIVIGKPERPRWQDVLLGSVADDLLRQSGVADVYVLSGDSGPSGASLHEAIRATSPWHSYAAIPFVVALCTAVTQLMDWQGITEANLVMVYLLGVVGVALRGGRGPSALAAVLSVIAFNFFFVAPRYTLAIHDSGYLITLTVMLVVGLVIGTLTARFQQQARAARERERRTAALYALSRAFASTRGLDALVRVAADHIHRVFASAVVLLLPDTEGRLRPWGGHEDWVREMEAQQLFGLDDVEQEVAQWVFDHRELAGVGTNTLPRATGLYLPLAGSHRAVGVLGVRPQEPARLLDPEQVHLLEAFASHTALAIERAQLANEAQQATVEAETERLRSALLSSVSHDLRTPLAIITGTLSSLAQAGATLDAAARDELAQAAADEALRLNHLLSNLLEMTRLEAGAIRLRTEWQTLEEVVGVAVARVAGNEGQPGMLPGGRPLSITLPPDLPLVPLDSMLIEQVLVNLLANAIQHTPPGTPVALRARPVGAAVEVTVADRGPGLPPGAERQVFDKFYRGGADSGRGNVGLGLAICKGMVEAHGGQIWAENGPEGGAVFRFTLPIVGVAPTVPEEVIQALPATEG